MRTQQAEGACVVVFQFDVSHATVSHLSRIRILHVSKAYHHLRMGIHCDGFLWTMTDVGFVYSLYFKLSPFLIHTDMRSFARFEHIIAFACLGAIFSFAYPGRIVYVACAIFLEAVSLCIFANFDSGPPWYDRWCM
jgi:hypothetical protein